jgi:hypothetical protein
MESGIVRGIVQEKKEAKATYDRAIRENRQAALLTKADEETFTCKIGNLKAGETCTIRLVTLTEIQTEGASGVLKWKLPTTAAPSLPAAGYFYEIKHGAEFKRESTSSWLSTLPKPKFVTGEALPYRLGLTLDVKTPSSVTSITSAHHKIVAIPVNDQKTHHIVTLAEGSLTMDQEFEINIAQENPWGVRAVAEKLKQPQGAKVSHIRLHHCYQSHSAWME